MRRDRQWSIATSALARTAVLAMWFLLLAALLSATATEEGRRLAVLPTCEWRLPDLCLNIRTKQLPLAHNTHNIGKVRKGKRSITGDDAGCIWRGTGHVVQAVFVIRTVGGGDAWHG